jgi:CRISPR-associated protein Csd1
MQRFADRPYSTWRTIELSISPYKIRLRSSRGAFLWEMDKMMDDIAASFAKEGSESFINDRPLSGEFLLAYHCQRRELRSDKSEASENNVIEENQVNQEIERWTA